MSDGRDSVNDYPLPPGSFGLPFLGEALSLTGDTRRFFLERYEEHGPVFKTRLAGRPFVCFVGAEGMTFLQDPDKFDRVGANGPPAGGLMTASTLPLMSGDEHQVRKALLLQAFSDQALEKYAGLIDRIVARWVERWQLLVEITWLDEFQKMSLGVINALLLGETTGSSDPSLEAKIKGFVNGFEGVPIRLPVTGYGRAFKYREQLLKLIDNSIALHKQRHFDTIMSQLIAAREDGIMLSDDAIRNEVLHLCFAMYSGVSLVMTGLVLALAQHRAVMSRAREEVLEKAPSGPLTPSTLNDMPYLQMLGMEVRRINPVIAMTFMSRVRETCVFNNYRLPKDWLAVGGIYATMNNSDTFVNPSVFDPERFSPERSQGREPNSYCPQGAGPLQGHHCAGQTLTDMLIKIVAIHLLRGSTWNLRPGQDISYSTGTPLPFPRDGVRTEVRRWPQ